MTCADPYNLESMYHVPYAKHAIIACVDGDRWSNFESKDTPWRIQEHFVPFEHRTRNKAVIMGRNCFEMLGRSVPQRFNIVITLRSRCNTGSAARADTFAQAQKLAEKYAKKYDQWPIFYIGGMSIYERAKRFCDALYVTCLNRVSHALPEVHGARWYTENLTLANTTDRVAYVSYRGDRILYGKLRQYASYKDDPALYRKWRS